MIYRFSLFYRLLLTLWLFQKGPSLLGLYVEEGAHEGVGYEEEKAITPPQNVSQRDRRRKTIVVLFLFFALSLLIQQGVTLLYSPPQKATPSLEEEQTKAIEIPLGREAWEGLISEARAQYRNFGAHRPWDGRELQAILLEGGTPSFAKKKNYAYSIRYLCEKRLTCAIPQLLLLAIDLVERQESPDPINIFQFDQVLYIGLESRKEAYRRDREEGSNPIYNRMSEAQRGREPLFNCQIRREDRHPVWELNPFSTLLNRIKELPILV